MRSMLRRRSSRFMVVTGILGIVVIHLVAMEGAVFAMYSTDPGALAGLPIYHVSGPDSQWTHVMLASPLGHAEALVNGSFEVYGRGRMGRSGLLSRERLAPVSEVAVTAEWELGAALVLYQGNGAWQSALELRLEDQEAVAYSIDQSGNEAVLGRLPGISQPADLLVRRDHSTFTLLVNGRQVWQGRAPVRLDAPRVMLRAIGDTDIGPRERRAVFSPVRISAVAEEQTVSGRVVDERGRPLSGASVRVAGDPFVHTLTDADGLFSITGVVSNQTLVCAAEGIGMGTLDVSSVPQQDVTCIVPLEETPRPEYPAPYFERNSWWQNLNGVWQFALGKRPAAGDADFPYHIRVPFPWTTPLATGEESLVSERYYLSPWAGLTGDGWYRRTVVVAEDFPEGHDLILHFGAVNYQAEVYWDGTHVASHEGGYGPFEVNLGPGAGNARHELIVHVSFPADYRTGGYPVGKQAWWFSHAPGIWQTVWLEARSPEAYIKELKVRPELTFVEPLQAEVSEAAFVVMAVPEGNWTELVLKVVDSAGNTSGSAIITATADEPVRMEIHDPQLWEPDNPHLYEITAELRAEGEVLDAVRTYSGLREVRVDWAPGHDPGNQDDVYEQYQYMYLNNRPLYMVAVLDQGYNPWGGYTYPSYGPANEPGSILFDIAAAKELGYNMIRIHIKQNEPLWLHAAAKEGVLIWDEVPSQLGDLRGKAWERLKEQIAAQVDRDFNNPAIVIRSILNEAWGASDMGRNPETQENIIEAVKWHRQVEPHRLVIDNSSVQGWGNRHLDTDINDEHRYIGDYKEWRAFLHEVNRRVYPGSSYNFHHGGAYSDEFGEWTQAGQPFVISEYTSTPGNTLAMRLLPKIAGYVRVNLTDQEYERGTPFTATRERRVQNYAGLPESTVIEHTEDAVIIDAPPVTNLFVGETGIAPVYVAAFSRGMTPAEYRLHLRLVAMKDMGPMQILENRTLALDVPQFTVSRVDQIQVTMERDTVKILAYATLERNGEVVGRHVVTWEPY